MSIQSSDTNYKLLTSTSSSGSAYFHIFLSVPVIEWGFVFGNVFLSFVFLWVTTFKNYIFKAGFGMSGDVFKKWRCEDSIPTKLCIFQVFTQQPTQLLEWFDNISDNKERRRILHTPQRLSYENSFLLHLPSLLLKKLEHFVYSILVFSILDIYQTRYICALLNWD